MRNRLNMKKIPSLIVLLFISSVAFTQQTPGEAFAEKVATRMKDSLQLSVQQKEQIYQVSLQLHNAMMSKWQQYTAIDSVRKHVQRIENTRDSLYRPVLTQEQYLLYLSKKKNLINNN